MKTDHITLLAAFILLAAPACQDEVANSASGDYWEIELNDSTCPPSLDEDRKTLVFYKNEPGEIRIMQFSHGPQKVIAPERIGQYMISDIVQTCNYPVPEGMEKLNDGDKIYFSGELKEAYPTENILGNFFKLTMLKVKIKRDSPPPSVE